MVELAEAGRGLKAKASLITPHVQIIIRSEVTSSSTKHFSIVDSETSVS